jgi:hypothetical protein
MILEADMSFAGFCKSFKLRKLALLDEFRPFVVSHFELVVDNSIHRDLALVGRDANEELIPLAGRPRSVWDCFFVFSRPRYGLRLG